MTQSTVSERLKDYFTDKRLTIALVSRDAGIQYDTLLQILSGKVKAMGVDKFAAIWQAYPDMDAWYILTGQVSKDVLPGNTVEELRQVQRRMNQFIEDRIQELT